MTSEPQTLREIATALFQKGACCRWCGYIFELDDIDCYPHDGGIEVKGKEGKQWVYMHCEGCGYDWALWKLLEQIRRAQ